MLAERSSVRLRAIAVHAHRHIRPKRAQVMRPTGTFRQDRRLVGVSGGLVVRTLVWILTRVAKLVINGELQRDVELLGAAADLSRVGLVPSWPWPCQGACPLPVSRTFAPGSAWTLVLKSRTRLIQPACARSIVSSFIRVTYDLQADRTPGNVHGNQQGVRGAHHWGQAVEH